jgi:hypothetical protein
MLVSWPQVGQKLGRGVAKAAPQLVQAVVALGPPAADAGAAELAGTGVVDNIGVNGNA